MRSLLFYTMLVLLCACSPKITEQQEASIEEPVPMEEGLTDRTLFLGFDIFKGEGSEPDFINLNDVAISPGFLKRDITSAPTIPEGKIKCTLLDAYNKEIKSTLVDNPLIQNQEYIEDDSHDHDHGNHEGHNHSQNDKKANQEVKGKIGRKIIKLKQGYFQFRARYDDNIRMVKVEIVGEGNTPGPVFVFNIAED